MSRWDIFLKYSTGPKAPPPEHGIRMKQAGATWWGQRWIEALEDVLRGDSGRLARGRTYARAGRAHDLVVDKGAVTAKVTGSRPTPYRITIALTAFDAATWNRAIAAMAKKAQFSAELLAGEMPRAIDEAFVEAGVTLFPKDREDLRTSCSCPDWGDPCKHVAATHYVLGEALDRDPFMLFELRGRTKAQVLEALRAARGGPDEAGAKKTRKPARNASPEVVPRGDPEVATVTLGALKAADYDQPREPLPTLHFRFDEPVSHGAVLRQLGVPGAWEGDASPAEALAPLVRAAAERARRIAMADAGADPGEEAPAESVTRAKPARSVRSAKTVTPKPAKPVKPKPARPAAARIHTARKTR